MLASIAKSKSTAHPYGPNERLPDTFNIFKAVNLPGDKIADAIFLAPGIKKRLSLKSKLKIFVAILGCVNNFDKVGV